MNLAHQAPTDSPTGAPLIMLRVPEVCERIGLRPTKLYELIAAGEFPRPVKIGRLSRFPSHQVDAWIAERIADRDSGGGR